MTVTVVSACYGGYDVPTPPIEQHYVDVRWVMVTDGKVAVPEPWEHVIEPRDDIHPRFAAKRAKSMPFLYADTDVAIWLDASAQIYRRDFVSMCVGALGDGDVAQWVHPQRDCIRPEADVSAAMLKYDRLPVHAQVSHYISGGHPEHFGLWATGCMAWNRGTEPRRVEQVGLDWLYEQFHWTYQDQLSWPVIVRRYGLDVRPLPGGLWDRDYLAFRPHGSDL